MRRALPGPPILVLLLLALATGGCKFDPQLRDAAVASAADAGEDGAAPSGSGDASSDLATGGDAPGPGPDSASPLDLAPAGDRPDAPAPDAPQPGVEVGAGDGAASADGAQPTLANGAGCTSGAACGSGFCVDGVCCESLCAGQCQACAESGRQGKCLAVTGAPRAGRAACAGTGPCAGKCDGVSEDACAYPGGEIECAGAQCQGGLATPRSVCDRKGACPAQTPVACAPYSCAGNICSGGCSAAQPCPADSYCSGGKCLVKKALGLSCAGPEECQGGHCVDGVCCENSCDGSCRSCGQSANPGRCLAVRSADDDHCTGKTCDADGVCKDRPGSDCAGNGDCATGSCVDGKCCKTSACGTCQSCLGGGGVCVARLNQLDPDTCTGTCDAGGTCKSKQGQPCGAGCVAGTSCSADGYCCDQACTSACLACDLPGLLGTCSPVPSGNPHGAGKTCGAGTCAGTCAGRSDGQCNYPTPGPVCAAPSCTGGMAVGQSTCMNGNCVAPAAMVCSNGCDGTVCKAACTSNANCPAGHFCGAGSCHLAADRVVTGTSYGKHSCVRLTDGTVRCWGKGLNGQLGNGMKVSSHLPVQAVGVSGVTSLVLGSDHSCALLAGGAVKCWGANDIGQVSGTPMTSTGTPVDVPGITGALALGAGALWTCAILSDGTVTCWGLDGNNLRPTPGSITGATAIGAGENFTCVVVAGGQVRCWGDNGGGRLGDTLPGGMTGTATPVYVKAPGGGANLTGATAVVAGYDFACALLSGGSVACWGNGSQGQKGDGTIDTVGSGTAATVMVSGLSNATAIAAGAAHICVLTTTGGISCWGQNNAGQLGRTTTHGFSGAPAPVTGISGATGVASGFWNGCALLSDGSIKCWGFNDNGQLGVEPGTTSMSTTPLAIPGW